MKKKGRILDSEEKEGGEMERKEAGIKGTRRGGGMEEWIEAGTQWRKREGGKEAGMRGKRHECREGGREEEDSNHDN